MQAVSFLSLPSRALAAIALCISLLPAHVMGARGAAIRLPDELAAGSTRIEFEGSGGYNRGSYQGDEFRAEFTRIESRLGVFDPLYVADRGRSSFTIRDSDGADRLSATCQARRNAATVRVVTLDLKKLTYICEFGGPQATDESRFVLGEPKREGFKEKLLARERRRGEAFMLGHEIVIESVHEYDGSRLDSQAPLGYLLESNGVAVAAIDLLDWNPVVHLREWLSDSSRQAAVIVALALAVLRDPANTALED